MPTLMLLRHAKSDSDDPKIEDHVRPLAARGRKDAPRMGRHIRDEKWEPALVLCSTSARTRETWDLVAPEFRTKPKVQFERSIYMAAWPALLSLLQGTPSAVPSLMLIGHNPGMEQLALALAREPKGEAERKSKESMGKKFPTCALAILEFEGSWRAAELGGGKLTAFVRPKDLDDD